MQSLERHIPVEPVFEKTILELPKLENIENLKSHCLNRVHIKDEIWKPIGIHGFRHMQISNFGRIYYDIDDHLFSPYLYEENLGIKGFDRIFYRMRYVPTYNDSSEESGISVPVADLLRMTFGGKDKNINIRSRPKDENIFNITFENIDFYDKNNDYEKYAIKSIYINGIKTTYAIDTFGYFYNNGKNIDTLKKEIGIEDKLILTDISGKKYYRKRYELMGKAFLPNPGERGEVRIVNKKMATKIPPNLSCIKYRNVDSKHKKDPIIFFY